VLPAVSVIPTAPPDRVAVYVVEGASDAVGSNGAVEPLADTYAATGAPPGSRNTNVLELTLAAEIGSLNVAVTFAPAATAVAPDAGDTLDTVGGVVSAAAAVVNDHE